MYFIVFLSPPPKLQCKSIANLAAPYVSRC
jgi:hypothetical protein